MAITIQPPNPGDLIRSNYMKQLIDQLVGLDARITSLESVVPGAGGKLSILQMDPTDVTLGQELRIYGVNFGVPAENTVTFDAANPTNQFKPGSSGGLLILDVPLTLSLVSDAQTVTVAVSSARGYDFRQITIRKPQATLPSGTLAVGLTPPAGVINAGSSVVFAVTIDARSTLDEVFNLTPVVPAVAVGQTPWQAVMVTDASGTTQLPQLAGGPTPPPWQMRIPKPAPGTISTIVPAFVRVTIPANTAVAQPFVRLEVQSSRNPGGFSGGSSGDFKFTLGQSAPANQTIKFGAFTATSGSVAANVASFSVPTNPGSRLNYVVPTLKAGNYQISLSFDANSNGWGASFASFSAGQAQLLKSFTLNADGDEPGEQIFISGAAPTGAANLNITVLTPAPNPLRQPTADDLKNATAYGVFTMTLSKA
ncbi:MAG TPA: hypothetical protein VKE96_18980 [Vicinamibacterales bacterium]|nr:hypothetical protein [Vicinamibacterales bacterium]